VTSNARRVPAFWNLATAAGSPVAVVDWWATWPAEAVLGAVVSERVHFWRQAARGTPPEDAALTYPDALQAEIGGLVMAPDDVTWEDARRELSYLPGGQGLNIAHSSGALLTRAGSPVRLTVSSRR